jgi:Tfp pilus assembly protein PilO
VEEIKHPPLEPRDGEMSNNRNMFESVTNQLTQETGRNRMWQNRSVIVLALIVLAIMIIGWVVQLAGGLQQRRVSQSQSMMKVMMMNSSTSSADV